jgi:hypothetical protein
MVCFIEDLVRLRETIILVEIEYLIMGNTISVRLGARLNFDGNRESSAARD